MELILDLQQHEFMPVWSNNDELSIEAGFKVQIHDQSEPPFIHELGFGIAPGFQTLVAAQEQQVGFLPPPWGDCEGDANVEDHKYYQNYSISACRITCETKIVTQKCNCRWVWGSRFLSHKLWLIIFILEWSICLKCLMNGCHFVRLTNMKNALTLPWMNLSKKTTLFVCVLPPARYADIQKKFPF